MNKKILFISIGVLLLVMLAFLVYFSFPKESRMAQERGRKIPTAVKISKNKLFFPALNEEEQNVLYFNTENGPGFYLLSLVTGEVKKISQIDTPDELIWSPTRKGVILRVTYDRYVFEKYGSTFQKPGTPNGTILYWFYDLNKKTLKPLDPAIQTVAWSPDGEKIVYQYLSEAVNVISIANPDGNSWKKIADVQWEITRVGFISPEKIYFYPVFDEMGGVKVYGINLATKKAEEIINQEVVLDVWGATEKLLIFQLLRPNQNEPSLALFSLENGKITDLKIKTEKNKIVFSNNSGFLITAVPQGQNKSDKLYKIDPQTGKKTEIRYKSKEKIDAENLMITKDGKTLYFTSNGYLYKLAL